MCSVTKLSTEKKIALKQEIYSLVTFCGLNTDYLEKASDCWILVVKDELVGYVGLEKCPKTGNLHLQSLVVKKSLRKKGYGKALVEKVQQDVKQELFALTLFWNKNFYTKLGFKHIPVGNLKKEDAIAARPKHLHCLVLLWTP